MGFSTTINVPSRDADRLMKHLAGAGFIVLDRGVRIMTDEGPNAEASLDVLYLGAARAGADDALAPTAGEVGPN